MERLPDRRSLPYGDTGRWPGDGADATGADGDRGAGRRGPRVHLWRASRTLPLPGALALVIVVPVLLAVGVATIGLFAAGMAGLLSAPRLLRRRGAGERRAGERSRRRPTIVLERDDYRRMN